ncbi:MAG: beta-glucosidase [Candidatus Riflebacteria bacterium]|nr:beta-glucosidase [Candidatus Riflebacteria bacterium]
MEKLSFPKGFIWGAATSAIQIEGSPTADGKGPSVWDSFCKEHPERIYQRESPEIACDHYKGFREDARLVKELGHNGYRLSISWPRLFPEGAGTFNAKGAAFYDELFDELLKNGIEPNVTLYHWDLPLALADKGGWENPETIEAFVNYAEKCFSLYGDRIKLWSTLNEPAWTTLNGYVTGLHPPCKTDYRAALQVSANFLSAHARVVQTFRALKLNGKIGIALNLSPVFPASQSFEDVEAAALADAVLNKWFSQPVLTGGFPKEATNLYNKEGLFPHFEDSDFSLLNRNDLVDFVGVNYYYPHYATSDAKETAFHLNITGDKNESCLFSIAGLFRFVKNPTGTYTEWAWEIAPEVLYQLLKSVHLQRPGLPIYVTENGIGRDETLENGTVDDQERINFVKLHLEAIYKAITEDVDVKGYYMWSLMDNFSWINGFKKRYGFLFVDRKTLKRYPKKSAYWYKKVAADNGLAAGQ